MNKSKHLSKAAHNEKFFNSFDADKSDFRDWIVVGIFYSVLHYYESYFADANKHSRDHNVSDEWISQDEKISDTYFDYRELKEYRWQASYASKIFSSQDIKNNILPKFGNIKQKILKI